MVWPFWSSDQDGTNKNGSPQQLDPQLREFLKQQNPAPYETASSSSVPPKSSGAVQSTASPGATLSSPDTDSSGRPDYARKSAFVDGRYDHLWKTYRSREEIESTNKTDAEKASDLIDSYKTRDASIKTAALENCSSELLAQWDCTNGNNWARKATMCREEGRQIGRCLIMQGRFLRALGYLSEAGRLPEIEEDVQLHADDLYRRMRQQEAEQEAARKEGIPEPAFPSLVKEAVARGAGGKKQPLPGQVFFPKDAPDSPDDPAVPAEAEGLQPRVIKDIKDKLRPLGPVERAMERAAIANDIGRATLTAQDYDYLNTKATRDRQERRDTGTASLGDRFAGLFGR